LYVVIIQKHLKLSWVPDFLDEYHYYSKLILDFDELFVVKVNENLDLDVVEDWPMVIDDDSIVDYHVLSNKHDHSLCCNDDDENEEMR